MIDPRRILGMTTALLSAVVGVAHAESIDFNRDIRPILSDKCFRCHGPDEGERQTAFRLDVKEIAFGELDNGGYAIVPGASGESELVSRIISDDPDQRMPPAESGKSLTPGEIDLLKRWISVGAPWSDHWAFVAPQRPPLPKVANHDWVRNPIDYFVLAKLTSQQLRPTRAADKRTLIRRVTLDLTGLPPTVAEIRAFLADRSSDAYEKVVDRLLHSPRYGEHRARYWLDAARYGDTHGLHLDNERSIWPYRDWVINALNQNMPFDLFTIEQLAGDLLPSPTLSQRVATGFNRCNVTTSEGGSIDAEYLVRYAVDRVETTSTVWLGLTTGCAVCHDHKFDPVSQREFYQLMAYFYSQTERAMDGNALLPPPSIKAPTTPQTIHHNQLLHRRTEVDETIAEYLATAMPGLGDRADEYQRQAEATSPPTDTLLHCKLDESDGDRVSSTGGQSGLIDGTAVWDTGKIQSGLRLDGMTHVDFGDVASFERDNSFSFGAWLYPTGSSAMTVLSRMNDELAFRGYDLYIGDGRVFVHLVHSWDGDAIRVNTRERLMLNKWQHVFATYDGSSKASGVSIYVDGVRQELEITHDRLQNAITVDASFRVGRRSPSAPLKGIIDDVRVYARKLSAEEVQRLSAANSLTEILAIPAQQWTESQRQQLLDSLLKRSDGPYRELLGDKKRLADRIRRLEGSFPSTLVMQDMSKPRVTHVLKRGQYDQPGETVQPGVPAVLHPLPESATPDRMGLATWLTQRSNPLTARVTVNRFWQQYFGAGIVATTEDFGSQGQWPSHPRLLDWLAVELMDSGWDMKSIHRLIVTSATYRQSSAVRPEDYRRDPSNRWLARGPRYRLDAEAIRDGALATSGLLVERLGGRSVKPYQPTGLWSVVGYTSSNTANFKQEDGRALYRRSMYTFWKRTAPPPGLQILDAPSREVCVVRRPRTNTPAAALVLMNDVQYLEAARHLAERMLTVSGSDEERLAHGLERVVARRPDRGEAHLLLELLSDYRAAYQRDPAAAESLVAVGDSPKIARVEPAELAAWLMVASTILNLDEAVTKQ